MRHATRLVMQTIHEARRLLGVAEDDERVMTASPETIAAIRDGLEETAKRDPVLWLNLRLDDRAREMLAYSRRDRSAERAAIAQTINGVHFEPAP